MDVTREHISRILELRVLSFQTGFNLVNAAVVCAILESICAILESICAILESISGLEPLSVIAEP